MHLASVVEMVESGLGDRTVLGLSDAAVNGAEFGRLVRCGATTLRDCPAVVYAGENTALLPVAFFSAAWAGVPFVPVNYRLQDEQLKALVERHPNALVLADSTTAARLCSSMPVTVFDDWIASIPEGAPHSEPPSDDDTEAVVLYTSGTTSEPKTALLRHRHLMSYLLGSVEFGAATERESMLIAVPPYHVAGMANMLSNIFAGRRIVYLRNFEAQAWLDTVRREEVTNAMVVPTMLARIVDALEVRPDAVPTLRSLSYGGAKLPERVLLSALRLLPDVGFVNAYGLTETASTIAILGPDDHRNALSSHDPAVRRRLASAGQVLPTVEIEVRDEHDVPLPTGQPGIIFLRGEQVSGEYSTGSVLDSSGWFCTRDRGYIDDAGYLFIEGRSDDTIIRGGENIAPAEIEEILLAHEAVAEVCVVGLPDFEWGQRIAAAVVLHLGASATEDELQDLVRSRLRGSKTPEFVEFRTELPHTETGKLLRRIVQEQLESSR